MNFRLRIVNSYLLIRAGKKKHTPSRHISEHLAFAACYSCEQEQARFPLLHHWPVTLASLPPQHIQVLAIIASNGARCSLKSAWPHFFVIVCMRCRGSSDNQNYELGLKPVHLTTLIPGLSFVRCPKLLQNTVMPRCFFNVKTKQNNNNLFFIVLRVALHSFF